MMILMMTNVVLKKTYTMQQINYIHVIHFFLRTYFIPYSMNKNFQTDWDKVTLPMNATDSLMTLCLSFTSCRLLIHSAKTLDYSIRSLSQLIIHSLLYVTDSSSKTAVNRVSTK